MTDTITIPRVTAEALLNTVKLGSRAQAQQGYVPVTTQTQRDMPFYARCWLIVRREDDGSLWALDYVLPHDPESDLRPFEWQNDPVTAVRVTPRGRPVDYVQKNDRE